VQGRRFDPPALLKSDTNSWNTIMLPETEPAINDSALMDYRNLYNRLRTDGINRNDALLALLRENDARGRPVDDCALVRFVQEASEAAPAKNGHARGEDVPQDTQDSQILRNPKDSQDSQGASRRDKGLPAEAAGSGRARPQNKPVRNLDKARRVFREELAARVPSTLTFRDYVLGIFANPVLDTPEWQIDFQFVRHIKGHPSMANADAKEAFRRTDQLLRTWKLGAWEYWFGMSREDAEVLFLACWDVVRFLPGHTPLDNALELSRRQPLGLKPDIKAQRTDGYEAFVSLAGWLQVGAGDRPILLPAREVGALLGVQHTTVLRYRNLAKKDGYLTEVKEAKYGGRAGAGEATEFRFDVGRFACLKEAAAP
jgi:hypothetical protein